MNKNIIRTKMEVVPHSCAVKFLVLVKNKTAVLNGTVYTTHF